jgi:hypothetical protein
VKGVPSGLLAPGEGWEGVTKAQEEALIERWWRAHTPNDEWSAEFPYAGLARYAEFALAIGRTLANPQR